MNNLGRVVDALRAIVRETFPNYAFLSTYRYRVVQANAGDHRWHLQAVNTSLGIPNILPIKIHGGLAGASQKLRPGSVVLVSFIEGDPSQPVITHFEDADGPGFLPLQSFVDATEKVFIGTSDPNDDEARPIARVGDPVECLLPPACPFSGTLSGAPISGFITFVDTVQGIITAGAQKGHSK